MASGVAETINLRIISIEHVIHRFYYLDARDAIHLRQSWLEGLACGVQLKAGGGLSRGLVRLLWSCPLLSIFRIVIDDQLNFRGVTLNGRIVKLFIRNEHLRKIGVESEILFRYGALNFLQQTRRLYLTRRAIRRQNYLVVVCSRLVL